MRYLQSTDRARDIDAIAAECMAAVLKSQQQTPALPFEDFYAELLEHARWENDVLIAA
jgi:hypothetical protein